MLLTESEAANRQCPSQGTPCIGQCCMAWRWRTGTYLGYCGLGGNPAPQIPESEIPY